MSVNTSGRESGGVSVEHLVGQAFAKAAHLILDARTVGYSGDDNRLQKSTSSSSSRKKIPWFKLDTREVSAAKRVLDGWKSEQMLGVPLVLEIYVRPVGTVAAEESGTQQGQLGVLLERWTLQYAATSKQILFSRAPTKSQMTRYHPRAVYKRLSLMLRSLCSYLRLLPGHKLKQMAEMQREENFSLVYKIHSTLQRRQGGKGNAMKTYDFQPVDTADGEFRIHGEYSADISSKFLPAHISRVQKPVGSTQVAAGPSSLPTPRARWSSRFSSSRPKSESLGTSAPLQGLEQHHVVLAPLQAISRDKKGEDPEDNTSSQQHIDGTGRALSLPMEIPGSNGRRTANMHYSASPPSPQTCSGADIQMQFKGSSVPTETQLIADRITRGPFASSPVQSFGQPESLEEMYSETIRVKYASALMSPESETSSQSFPCASSSPDLPFAFTPTKSHFDTMSKSSPRPMLLEGSSTSSSAMSSREVSSLALLRRDSGSSKSFHLSEGFHNIGYSISPLHDGGLTREYSLPGTPSTFGRRVFQHSRSGGKVSPRKDISLPPMLLDNSAWEGSPERSPGKMTDRTQDDLPFAFAEEWSCYDEPYQMENSSQDCKNIRKQSLAMQLGMFTQLINQKSDVKAKGMRVQDAKHCIENAQARIAQCMAKGESRGV